MRLFFFLQMMLASLSWPEVLTYFACVSTFYLLRITGVFRFGVALKTNFIKFKYHQRKLDSLINQQDLTMFGIFHNA